ncbi:serine/threonine-protein kinase Aurora-3 [Chanos chanos]|uniref:Serine/threonine-protein kinase Aurora-3 n=1 Tax=Chanos chanos TaxID=29144 RepID=A0A6J2W458_CHACN|nr:serine/threonine-protein kinase Aurora-3-like [Chanos chanos]
MGDPTKTLAGGCFGKIYKEKYKDSWAALKKVPVGFITRQQLDRECRVYRNAQHPNVVKLLGDPWLRDSKWHIPLEFITGEDLETTIFKARMSKIQLTPSVKATIITGMSEGLLHLHSKNIVHQDIKPDNIMVEHQTHRAVIIDLGLAKFSHNGITTAANLGNEAYSAPEILNGGVRDMRSDVWAMGKVIAEFCNRVRLPTIFVSPAKIEENLKDHPYCKCVSKMVDSDPSKRATMAGVIDDIRRAGISLRAEERGTRTGPDIGGINKGVKQKFPTVTPTPQRTEVKSPLVGAKSSFLSPTPQRTEVKSPLVGAKSSFLSPTPQRTEVKSPLIGAKSSFLSPTPQRTEVKPPLGGATGRLVSPLKEEAQALTPLNSKSQMSQSSLLQNMSFPCPLPTDGKVVHRRYVSEDGKAGTLEYKEVVMNQGRVVKYEDLKYTKDF